MKLNILRNIFYITTRQIIYANYFIIGLVGSNPLNILDPITPATPVINIRFIALLYSYLIDFKSPSLIAFSIALSLRNLPRAAKYPITIIT